ncbi:MAG: hypothetical protein ABDH21_02870 [bacterium]
MNVNIYVGPREYNALCTAISQIVFSQSREVKEYVPIGFNYRNHLFEIQENLEREYIKALGLEDESHAENLASFFIEQIDSQIPQKLYYVKGKKVEVIAANPEEGVKLAKESDEFINRFASYLSKPFHSKQYVMTLHKDPHRKVLTALHKPGQSVVIGQVYNQNGNSTLERDVLYHELGHSLLDGIVPQAKRCFSEAFADIMAFLNQASKPDQVKDIKDFRKSNRISQIAENSAIAKDHKLSYIRDLAQQHRYNWVDEYEAGSAVASAFYRTWANYVEGLKSKGIPQEEAVKIANDKFSRLAIRAAENLANHKEPKAIHYAESILKNLDSDHELRKLYYEELQKIGYKEALEHQRRVEEELRKLGIH